MNLLRDAGADGRLGKMKADERAYWREQARAMGWHHECAFGGKTYEELTDKQRLDRAYKFAARHLAEEFRTAAVSPMRSSGSMQRAGYRRRHQRGTGGHSRRGQSA